MKQNVHFKNGTFYHQTGGGAEYLSTTFIDCPNGEKMALPRVFMQGLMAMSLSYFRTSSVIWDSRQSKLERLSLNYD